MITKRKRKKFTKEFKADAVRLVTENGYSCAEVSRRLDISANNVSKWVREQRDELEQITDGTRRPRRELEKELKDLRKENQRLKMEREILKKAAAFFANESK
jgi:transposase